MEQEIVRRIYKIRKQKDLSLENMGDGLGISTVAYRKIELNETSLKVDRLYKIAKILDTPLTELMGLSTFSNAKTENDVLLATQELESHKKFHKKEMLEMERMVQQLKARLSDKDSRIRELANTLHFLEKRLDVRNNGTG